ncbi:uncharacterized protein N0V89_002051 [Didymosphaeria variabile]|uniref:Nnf1-domain-containing protein n=1 Tax=Didymosphaeria variabile TaxID=1932322 RepID=A0A9W8XQY7_9PLEO|nr:uncharacterized protein N0V89_002051 [Didymosphaeria variabile]KAJ4357475.1 hypothetical protein N0V89_002051 [Didymosphaeria variabile]
MPAATEAESRSPSPAPPPPIADTPGPRAQGLIRIYNQAVEATLKKCSTANFASCFPTAAEQAPEVLESLRSQVLNQLQRTWKLNFDEVMAKRNVVQLLNSLDQSIEDARLRKKRAEANGGPVETPVPPHTLPPAEIHLAHLMPFLETQAAEMNTRLADTQQANTQLLSTVTSQRAEIEALVHGLENVIRDLEMSAQMMGQEDVQSLSKEMREFEKEMKK